MENLILAIFTAINIPLALLVLRSNSRSWTNRTFALLIALLTVYLAVNAQVYVAQNEYGLRFFFAKFIMANAAAINLLVFLFLYAYPSEKLTLSKKLLLLLVTITIILFVASFANFIFKSINISEDNTVTPEPGMLMPVFGLHTLGLVFGGIISIFRKFRRAAKEDKGPYKYIFFAFAILFFLILVFNFVLPVVFKIGFFVPFLPLYILIFLAIVAYAIVRHEVFSIKVIATEIFIVLLLITQFSRIFVDQSSIDFLTDIFVFVSMLIFGILLSISVNREVEQREQLAVLNKKLEELDRQKDEFLNVASHELRAPMTAIKGYLSMVQDGDAGEIPAEAKDFLGEAVTETERMIRLVNNMLNVARIEEGRMVFEEGEVNLSDVIGRVYNEFKFEAESKSLEYSYQADGGVRDRVVVDVDRIHEVVSNLINNAIKYTDRGKIVIRLKNPSPERVRFEVEDTGPGMTPEEVGKLFNKFYRTESYVGRKMGTGLGLYISKLLVQKFGGTIGVTSQKDVGSLFWFELPLKT